MAASLLALLSQQTPNLATRKALILTGLQHDFLSPDGKLPVNNLDSGFLKRTKTLINEFRPHGQVIWIRTEIDASRHPSDLDEDACNVITSLDEHEQPSSEDDSEDDASDSETPQPSRKRKPGKDTSSPVTTQGASKRNQRKSSLDEASTDTPAPIDEEHFLTETANREACFIKGTLGADYAAEVKSYIQPTDLQVTKAYYSAFSSSSLLSTLRMKLITELYVCGAMTNLNVYATSMDAARYGIKITLVEDCLGYRHKERHDLAIKRLVDIMDARVTTSDQVMAEMGAGATASRSRVTGPTQLQPTLGANIDAAADMLEVASSDDEDDEDLLSVRASPSKSNRPSETKGSRPQDEHLHEVDTGSEPHPQFQRLATAESNTGAGPSQRTATDDIERPGQVETVELEIARSLNRLGISDEANRPTATTQTTTKIVNRSDPDQAATAAGDSKQSLPTSPASQKKQKAKIRSALSRIQRRNRKAQTDSMIARQSDQPLFGVDKEEESQDSSIQYDLLSPDRVDGLFLKLKEEVKWQKMHHQTGEVPRLVCCQGTIDFEGNMPIYRHPSDETIPLLPWSKTVDEIRLAAEAIAGHELNHALIQLYRAGTDFISEHSDKTLDIRPDSFIVNASFGAERVMRLRTKRSPQNTTTSSSAEASTQQQHSTSRTTHRIRLPHNSALLMSLETNAQYLHSINADKRPSSELTPAEKAYDGQRISLTFRHIGTYLDAKSEYIWGQGATGKEREDARKVINGDAAEVDKLVRGFGAENAAAEIAWAEWYGGGSDVLHLK
jgi:nicotinamidase-related amidase/alkylated DNA repair dioxygenase AlkB